MRIRDLLNNKAYLCVCLTDKRTCVLQAVIIDNPTLIKEEPSLVHITNLQVHNTTHGNNTSTLYVIVKTYSQQCHYEDDHQDDCCRDNHTDHNSRQHEVAVTVGAASLTRLPPLRGAHPVTTHYTCGNLTTYIEWPVVNLYFLLVDNYTVTN